MRCRERECDAPVARLAVRPCLTAFSRAMALPSFAREPVLNCAFWRLRSMMWAGVSTGIPRPFIAFAQQYPYRLGLLFGCKRQVVQGRQQSRQGAKCAGFCASLSRISQIRYVLGFGSSPPWPICKRRKYNNLRRLFFAPISSELQAPYYPKNKSTVNSSSNDVGNAN